MSVTVIAVLKAKPGRGQDVIEMFREVSPLVHEENGCEMYAAHLEQSGDTVVIVERWTTVEDLQGHAAGPAVESLGGLGDLLVTPLEFWLLDPVALGDVSKGIMPT